MIGAALIVVALLIFTNYESYISYFMGGGSIFESMGTDLQKTVAEYTGSGIQSVHGIVTLIVQTFLVTLLFIRGKGFAQLSQIRHRNEYRYKILAYMIAPDGENFYIFDLLIWEKTKIGPQRKKGEAPETAEATEAIEGTEEQAKNIVEEEPRAETTKPAIEERFSADVVGSFGVSIDQYQRDMEVREVDGFVTMDLITGSK